MQEKLRNNPTLMMVLTFVIIAFVVIFFRMGQTQPRLTGLVAEGRYQMSGAMLESGVLLVDAHITNIANYQEGLTFEFGTGGEYRYFKITIFYYAYGRDLPSLFANLSNGEQFSTWPGTTHIIYTAWPWSDGEHYITLFDIWDWDYYNTQTHIQVLVTSSLESITEGILPPPLSQIITVTQTEYAGAAPHEVAFQITNHSQRHIAQSMNYFVERETRPGVWEQQDNVAFGLMRLDIPPGGSQIHISNMHNVGDGSYRIRVHRFYTHWVNENGVALTRPFDLISEFHK